MTRSHVPLHYLNERLRNARAEAWKGKDPGRVSLILGGSGAFLFLELSDVGGTMADGTDEDGARAAAMDEWIVWEVKAEERTALEARA